MSEAEMKPKKRIGRPPKNPDLGKRINMMFRLNEARRDQLMRAAEASGRSMSEEIENRIERSFADVDLLISYFGSSETLKLSQAVGLLARSVELRSGNKWTDDPQTKGHLAGAISRFFHIYFYEHNEAHSKDYISALSSLGGPLDQMMVGHNVAEVVAEHLGIRSKAREKLEEFLSSPEGREAQMRFQEKQSGEQGKK